MTQKLFKLEWNEHDWPSYQAKIYGIQNAIYEASKKGKSEEIKELQNKLLILQKLSCFRLKRLLKKTLEKRPQE